MLFSVVIPVYNVEKYLDECLRSILCQVNAEMPDCEIILVDDGSTDESGMICDKYQENYPNLIRTFHNTNHGLLSTRRFGYKKARGEYIINCDSDDCLEHTMLADIKEILAKYDTPDMILFNYYSLIDGEKKIGFSDIFTTETDCLVSKRDVLKEFMLRHSVVSVCGKVYRRSCVDVEQDYSEWSKVNNGEDTLQSIEFYNRADTFVYLNKPLYDYRIGSGMTKRFDPDFYFAFKTIYKQLEMQKMEWGLPEFDQLFAVKVLQTAGRAITQSRFGKSMTVMEHVAYLRKMRDDEMFRICIEKLKDAKHYLQHDYVILLMLLKQRCYLMIVFALRIKNWVER